MISRRSKEGDDGSMWGGIRPRRRSTPTRGEAIAQTLGALANVRGRFAKSTRPRGRAYPTNVVGLGIGALLLLTMISLLFWLLRRRARETDLATPEPEDSVEAAPPEEEMVSPPAPPSAEDASLMEQPPPGEERPERRGETPTSPPSPREAPPPGEERPGHR